MFKIQSSSGLRLPFGLFAAFVGFIVLVKLAIIGAVLYGGWVLIQAAAKYLESA